MAYVEWKVGRGGGWDVADRGICCEPFDGTEKMSYLNKNIKKNKQMI